MIRSILLACLFAACGGSSFDPGAGDDPGEGTGTLLVDGRASAEPRIAGARVAGDFETELSVRLSLGGAPVTAGTVVVNSSSGSVDLAFESVGDNAGRWTGRLPGYDEVYVLDVESGPDRVEGVRVDGPDLHVFTSPTNASTVDATLPIEVTWSSDDTADVARLDAEEIDELSVADSGSFTLPAGALKTEQDKLKENKIELSRTNTVVPRGGAAGSEWSVRVRNELVVIAQPAP